MAHRRRRRRGAHIGPALRQGQLDATIKYGPTVSALGELLLQSRQDFRQQVRAEKGAARGVEGLARQTVPKVRRDYNQAIRFQRGEQKALNPKLKKLGRSANDIKAASAREASGANRRLVESRTDALTELRDRISQAAAGAAFAVTNARQEYRGKRATIERQLVDVAGQQGLYAVTQALAERKAGRQYKLDLKKALGDLHYKKATLRETQRSNRAKERQGAQKLRTDRYKAHHPGRGGSRRQKPHLTPGQQNDAVDNIQRARSFIAKLESNPKLSSHQIRQILEQGYSVSSRGGKPGVKIPQFSHDYVNAAYDLYAFGHLSPANVRALRRRRVRIPRGWHPPSKRARRKSHSINPFS